MGKRKFEILLSSDADGHLDSIDSKHHSLILDSIEDRLSYQPLVETRNRKPIRQPAAFQDAWEIRFGPENRFRVFYQVDLEELQVCVLAIGRKDGNRLFVGGEEIELSLRRQEDKQ